MLNYRKLWESHNGPIPIDNEGRPYEIHHIDGDRSNNDLSNLLCVSIEEHYDIHYEQGDYGAAACVMRRMERGMQDSSVLSELAKVVNKKMVEDGTHIFLKRNRNGKMGNEFDSESSRSCALKRVKEGRHNFVGTTNENQQKVAYDRIKEGTIETFLNGKSKIAVGIAFGRAKKYAIKHNLEWNQEWDSLKNKMQTNAKKSR